MRLQLHRGFTFADAAALVPYTAALGVSHVYASPFLMARPGSTHGYDITDHNHLNPELGDAASFAALTDALHAHGMGLILDFVPNHMGVGGADNPWWLDVLEWGQASPYARFFDIDWDPAEPSLKGKVLLPFLGDHYGRVLEHGELKPHFDDARGSLSVRYYEHVFPIAVRDYAIVLRAARDRLNGPAEGLSALIGDFAGLRASRRSVAAQAMVLRRSEELKARLARLAGERLEVRAAISAALDHYAGRPGDPASFRPLHRLLERQAYRIAYWRVATAEINYRRFFDINDLAGLRMEVPELFEVSHRLVFRLIAEGKIQGLRLDHTDGLYDPEAYCRQLQERAAYLLIQGDGSAVPPNAGTGPATRRQPLYVLIEKILARHERLREDWAVDGTTGYEFMNLVAGLFVDPGAEQAMTATYHRFIGREVDFEELAVEAKRQMVETNLASELTVLAADLHHLAGQSWRTRDFTLTGIRDALIDIVCQFPVYRTYIAGRGVAEEDRRDLDWALARARKAAAPSDTSVHTFIHSVLTTDLRRASGQGYRRAEILRIAMKFQQFTGPVMAKSIEDTTFYRYHRLTSLNEVGGEPTRFGVSPAAFHHISLERQRRFPYTMLATATHDHKRGEDTRARISALTEMPVEWRRQVQRWAQLNRSKKREVDGQQGPGRNDEYLFYQTLIGTWPLDIDDPHDARLRDLADRLVQYMTKAMREAKRLTSWTEPNVHYEAAVEAFVRAVLNPARSRAFLRDVLRFVQKPMLIGAVNGLAQTLLKLTVPGMPDIYQGTEFWDLSLVDPDNRRPVDFAARRASLDADVGDSLSTLLPHWRDGRVKQYLIARTLAERQRSPALFDEGDYVSLDSEGAQSERVVAFTRSLGDETIVVVVPRLVGPLMGGASTPLPPADAWGSTAVALPSGDPGTAYRDVLRGAVHSAAATLRLDTLLADFPVALLRRETVPGA